MPLSVLLRTAAALVAGLFLSAGGLRGQDAPPPSVAGSWIFSVTTENGTGTPRVTLEQNGTEVTGFYSSPRLGSRRLLGEMRGDTLTFRIAPGPDGGGVIMTFTGVLAGPDVIEGSADFSGMGGATFSARRETPPGPDAR